MIVACPSCRAKFKIDETKIEPPGVRLRCARCQNLFAVRKRVVENPALAEEPAGVPAASPPAEEGRASRILVAHADQALCGTVGEILTKENFEVLASHDGVDALMKIQRECPRIAVIDAALPKMYGFEICEFMKRNESLRDVKVLLVAAAHNRDRYRRTAENLYGADDVLEEGEIASALLPSIKRLLSSPSDAEPPASVKAPVTTPEADDEHGEERKRARRLARIIVSDIALYNPDVFENGVRSGQLANLVREELEEGNKLFRSRIKAPVVDECDFIREALDACAEKKRQELGLSDREKGEGTSNGGEGSRPGDDPFAGMGISDDDF